MHLSRITIENFRNFSKLDADLAGNVVVVGENKVGKSNLLYALRLLFDPSLPDSARELGLADFWDGLDGPDATLLHKSAEGQATPFPGQTYPTASVTGMPSAV